MITLRNGKEFPPTWLTLACLLALLIGVGSLVLDKYTATQDRNTAQSNTQTLAQDIGTVCDTQGKLMVNDRDLCAKAEQAQQNPTEAIPGPKGDPGAGGATGKDGLPGPAGPAGAPGKDGEPGPPGTEGTSGRDGTDSLIPGPEGPPGADSTVPGPAGPQGEPGAPGINGTSPASLTITDKSGTTYTCTPNPPGSSTYTCSSGRGH